ncbi:MAG: primosomal protein N' [Pirellulaceae bacterium]
MGSEQRDLFDKRPSPWELDDQREVCVGQVVFAEFPFGPYDYEVPDSLRELARPGMRVEVPLGRGNRKRTGYCVKLSNALDSPRRLKAIFRVLDSESLLSPAMLDLASWMSRHYLCPLGQVLEAVVPSGVRGRAGTREQIRLRVPTSTTARLTQLKLPPKQARALHVLGESSHAMTPAELAEAAGCTQAPISALRRKKLVVEEVHRVHRGVEHDPATRREQPFPLNQAQQGALDAVLSLLREARHETIVIHGVTSSGNTEVYIRAIQEVIEYGRQAIVLVPEISLTPQTQARFQSRFDHVAVLHSHLTPSDRHWHWQQIAAGKTQVIVGARSAVFAPTPNLGLIVIDEEHDASFKQDKAPRYHARDVALQRAGRESVPVILGSATPSLESWQKTQGNDYQLVELPYRVSHFPLPDVSIVDLRTQSRGRRRRGAISQPLYQAVREALREDGQVILLLNRRGFSTTIQCPDCGYVAKCSECDISLTHHREGEKAICHYCDYVIPAPPKCPECGFEGIRYSGLGTQKLETEVRARFPDVPCLRMDSDSMSKPGSHEKALNRFRAGEVKIMLGTQMIAKGLDFPNVTLVGVINADIALHFPDFRATERTFQLVTQVAGRTGRGERGGRVIVQTFTPDHPAILAAQRHDYALFAKQELPVRREFGYPPYLAMIRIVVRGPAAESVEQFAEHIASLHRARAEQMEKMPRILGPAPAPLSRLRGNFRFHILLYHPHHDPLRELVRDATNALQPPSGILWTVDVDPVDML